MVFLAPEDEKRLDSVGWLQGSFLRGVQIDAEHRDVSVFATADRDLIELLCEDVRYYAVPNLFDAPESPRIVGLVVQPLEEFVVRLEFSNHPAQLHLQCGRFSVRRFPPKQA